MKHHIDAAREGLRAGLSTYRHQLVARRSRAGFSDALKPTEGIPGFTSAAELSLLYNLTTDLPGAGRIVEIGSYLGRSTIVLAHAARNAGRDPIVAVDPHTSALGIDGEAHVDTRERFIENVRDAGVEPYVELRHTTSVEAAAAWPGHAVDLLFVDGWHSTEAVRADLGAWRPFLSDGACVVFDDYLSIRDVRVAVDRLAAGGQLPGARVIVGKMIAFGPPGVIRRVPAPPGSTLLARLPGWALDLAVGALAPDRRT